MYKGKILDTVRQNNIVILCGSTGCGKTTKVPQFILDDCRQNGLFCNIIVAQPKSIAASSNAQRVCNERGWECGELVGYQVCQLHIQYISIILNETFETHKNHHNRLDLRKKVQMTLAYSSALLVFWYRIWCAAKNTIRSIHTRTLFWTNCMNEPWIWTF